MKFDGKILIIGCGSVSQCTIPLVLKLIEISPEKITVIDFIDNRSRIKEALDRGVKYVIDRVTLKTISDFLQDMLARAI